MLEIAVGLHDPGIPLSDVVGKTGTADPAQKVVGRENAGAAAGVTVMLIVNTGAHGTEGVKT